MLTIQAVNVGGALQPSTRLPSDAVSVMFDGETYSVITVEDLMDPQPSVGNYRQGSLYIGRTSVTAERFGIHFNRSSNFQLGLGMPHGAARCHDSGCRWDQIEPAANGTYDWSTLDAWVAGNSGKDLIYTLIGVPPGYSSDTTGVQNSPFSFSNVYIPKLCSPPTAGGLTALSAFITALCTRYPQIGFIEVWNESNSDGANYQWWWGTSQQLADLIKTVSVAAKAVRPTIQIVAAACVGFEVTGNAKSYSLTTLGLTATGDASPIHNRVDVISGHLYTSAQQPYLALQTTRELSAVLAGLGVSKPLWDTEVGLLQLEKEKGPAAVSDDRYVSRYFAHHLIAFAAGIQKVFWYTFDHSHMGYAARPDVVRRINYLVSTLSGKTLDVFYFDGVIVAKDVSSQRLWTFE